MSPYGWLLFVLIAMLTGSCAARSIYCDWAPDKCTECKK